MEDKKSFVEPQIQSYERDELAVPIVVTKLIGSGNE